MSDPLLLPGDLVSISRFVNACELSPEQASSVVDYLELLSLDRSLPSTMRVVHKLLTHLTPDFWHSPVSAARRLRSEQAAKVRKDGAKRGEPLKVETIRLELHAVRDFLSFLRDRDDLSGREWAEVRRLLTYRPHRRDAPPAPVTLSLEELTRLVNHARSRPVRALGVSGTLALLHLHMHAGLRAGEGRLLHWREVDFSKRQIDLHEGFGRRLKNWRATRQIPMTSSLFYCLNNYYIEQNDLGRPVGGNDRLFPTLKQHPFERLVSKWHCATHLRHTFATALAGIEQLSDTRMKQLMGHGSVKVTRKHYIGRPVSVPAFEPEVFLSPGV